MQLITLNKNTKCERSHFIIIGAQRSGTTLLYDLLDQHPSICMAKPVRPEPKYFLNNSSVNYNEYFRLYFNQCDSNSILFGEKSTSYYEHFSVIDPIIKTLPSCKVIIILRNPVYRAISNYFFSLNNGIEKRDIIEAIIYQTNTPNYSSKYSVNPFNYVGRGIYANYIPPFMNSFCLNFKVIFFEQLITDTNVITDIYKFLEVDSTFKPNNNQGKINESSKYFDNINVKVLSEVTNYLFKYYAEYNSKLEALLKIKVGFWYDSI